jgi:hypothetical protein
VAGTITGLTSCGGSCQAEEHGSFDLTMSAGVDPTGKLFIRSISGQFDYGASVIKNDPDNPATCVWATFSGSPVRPTTLFNPATLTLITFTMSGTYETSCDPPRQRTMILNLLVRPVFQGSQLTGLDFTASTPFGEDATATTAGLVPITP